MSHRPLQPTPPQRSRPVRPRRSDSASQVKPTLPTVLRRSIATGKLGALIVLLTSVGCLAYVLRAQQFVVTEADVQGVRSLSAADVNALAGVRGTPIWYIDTDAVAARIATNSYVATATVQLLLPAQVMVRVQEHQAAILWNALGINYEVAGDGQVLGPAHELESTPLIVYDTRPQPLEVGTYIDPDALNLAQTLNLRVPQELGITPTRYEWDPYYGLSMYDHDRQIAFGRLDDPALTLDVKLATLKTLLQDQTEWTLLDLRSSKPYYRQPSPLPTPTIEP